VEVVRRLGAHPLIGEALTAGELSESWAQRRHDALAEACRRLVAAGATAGSRRGLDGSGLPPYARLMRSMTFARPARALLTGMAACLVIGLAAGPALAAGTWTIRPGGAVTFGLVTATIKDTTTAAQIACRSGNLTGTLKPGSGLTGTSAGSITRAAISPCFGPGPLNWTITLLDLPWHINLLSYDRSTGLVHGTISHMEIRVKGSACRFVIDGTSGGASDGKVRFAYSDSTHLMKTSGGNLHIFNVTGCAGLAASGDPVSLTAGFTLAPAQTITSP